MKKNIKLAIVCKKSLEITNEDLSVAIPTGTVIELSDYSKKTPPKGTLFIDNKLHQRAKYPHLSAFLDLKHGFKKSSTTFRLDQFTHNEDLPKKTSPKKKVVKKKKINEELP